MNKKNFIHVDTLEKLDQLDRHLMEGDELKHELVAYDTETNGLQFHRKVIIGFSISTSKSNGWYIPLLEWHPDKDSLKTRSIDKEKREVYLEGNFVDAWTGRTYPEDVGPDQYQAPDHVKTYLKRWLASTPGLHLLMHNAVFDCNMTLYNMGIDLSQHLFCDTRLLAHFIDESEKTGLKDRASLWKEDLGFDPEEDANAEQLELGESVIRNGGKWNQSTKHVWRGDPSMVSKYACADTALTFGLFEVEMKKLEEHYTPEQVELFFEKEMMPICREVVFPMQFGGVKIDVQYFEDLKNELIGLIQRFEDSAMEKIGDLLNDFSIGKSMDEAVSKKRFLTRIIELEGLEMPTITQKGVVKESLSKPAVKKAYVENPHWLWGYFLGENELKYSEKKQEEIRAELYQEVLGRRYRFNLGSDMHLRWLLFDKLGNDKKSVPQTDSATADNPIPSCAAEVLEDHFKEKYDFIEDVMMFRKLRDMLSDYIEKAVTLHNNGWLHMDMDQAGTTSGRFSCRGGFNLQTLPKVEEVGFCTSCESDNIDISYTGSFLASQKCKDCKHEKKNIICYSVIKKGFVAPEGYKIVNADYSSLEPRCFAFMSGDDGLKDIYRKKLDMYAKVYCDVEDAWDKYSADKRADNFLKKVNPSLRDMVKPVVLGIPYGARKAQVAHLMGFKKTYVDRDTGKEREGLDVERGEAWIEKYLGTYPELRKYMEDCEIQCVTKGYVETVVGRRRHFKYAPFIQQLLDSYKIDRETFLDIPRKALLKEKTDHGLTKEGLKEFCHEFDIPYWQMEEKGYWAYIKGLFKNDLNNAKNVRIQGLAGHITNKGMLDTTRFFRQNGIDGYVCLQVHDEITCYVREDQAEFGKELLKLGMEENEFAKIVDIGMEADPIICDTLKESK